MSTEEKIVVYVVYQKQAILTLGVTDQKGS
jgi:hypothetical protein